MIWNRRYPQICQGSRALESPIKQRKCKLTTTGIIFCYVKKHFMLDFSINSGKRIPDARATGSHFLYLQAWELLMNFHSFYYVTFLKKVVICVCHALSCVVPGVLSSSPLLFQIPISSVHGPWGGDMTIGSGPTAD